MGNSRWWARFFVAASVGLSPQIAPGQFVDGYAGRTPQGDALRGNAQFLRGMAWYEVGSAQAMALNQQALAEWNRSVQAGYEQYLLDRARRVADRRAAVSARVEQVERSLAETQRRWRENPTQEDIRSGLALNALASDLADPRVPASAWAQAKVELPGGFALTSLVFRFANAPRYKVPGEPAPSVVAVGRMKVEGGWPVALRRPELNRERQAYERAVKAAIARCAAGQPLQARDVDRLRDALASLKERGERAIPAGQWRQVRAYVDQLDEATRIFLDQDFAEELIRDVETHCAGTVGELLAFMKKYRLLFAEGGDDPSVWATYERLHGLLRRQKSAIVFADAAAEAEAEKKASERNR
jgi:hypothetical protein